jgi:hypothetical protein
MGGPIVRTGTTPEFWKNWDNVFGKTGTKKPAAKKPAAKKAAASKPKAARKAKKRT